MAENANLPVSWNVETGAHIAWKTEIPGLGLSSPVVWDDVVFLTTAISSNPQMVFESKQIGMRDDRQDPAEQEFRVLAIDKRTGRILWNQLAVKSKPRVLRHPHNSYASPTPATDGKYLVAFFGSEGLYCYDLKGSLQWKKDLGIIDQGAFDVPDYQWGTASSPILWHGKVFLQVDMQRGSFLAAFDAKSGTELWRTPRDSKPAWSTPTIVEGPSRTELVTNGVEHIMGYDPETAIGDITGSKESIAWMRAESPYLSTPVVSGKYVFAFGNRGTGILNVYDAMTGATVYQQRIGQGTSASASAIAAGDRVYAANEDGEVYVIRAGSAYEEMAVNRMEEPVLATPAASGDTLFIRGASHLFAIRNK
ncbi:MAG: PQQ-binding-like beta-propeller repeat protein [Bryobacteraceae bacterium]